MSLYERLSRARIASEDAPSEYDNGDAPVEASRDPLAELKRKTHQALVAQLGPKLYDMNVTPQQLEQRVRQQLQEVLELEDTPLRLRIVSD